MSIIDRLAAAIDKEPSTELEGICRRAVAMEMRRAKRMLTADEIDDIVEDVVEEEAHADLEERFDGESVNVSDLEAENIPEDELVTFTDDDGEEIEGVVVEGRFARLKIRPDSSVRTISASISKHSESLAIMANSNEGINLQSLYHPVPDVNMPCPVCASRDVTPVWYDNGQVIACCNNCNREFDASIDDVAHATLAEQTVEDIDILPEHEVFGSVWLNGSGYGYEVYASGELVDSGEADRYDDVIERFDDIADAFDDIEEDSQVDFTNGESDVVDEIDGDDVYFEAGRKASRIRLARMVADGKAFVDNSRVASIGFVRRGRSYRMKGGSRFEVDSVWNGGVDGRLVSCTPDGRLAERHVRMSKREFSKSLLR